MDSEQSIYDTTNIKFTPLNFWKQKNMSNPYLNQNAAYLKYSCIRPTKSQFKKARERWDKFILQFGWDDLQKLEKLADQRTKKLKCPEKLKAWEIELEGNNFHHASRRCYQKLITILED